MDRLAAAMHPEVVSGLPRADLPPGPHRDLVSDLHALHHRAGWPSLRSLASTAGCSPTTVSAVFSAPRLPSWGLLEVLVDAMDGDVPRFHELWLSAGSGPGPAPAAATIAGRREELALVRLGLRQPGLLLVEGEAGIGKSRLIASAVADLGNDVLVASGDGLPLSRDVPLLPLTDALRRVWEHDGGELLRSVLADQPAYVAETVALLLPEVEVGKGRTPDDPAWARHRLLGALTRVLVGLAARRPFALVLEDLHWADAGTLDVVEHVLAQRVPVPVVATWRTGDPTIGRAHEEWRERVRRSPRSGVVELGPLTRDETAQQLGLVSGRPPSGELVDAVYRRTLGQPLFNEQLVSDTPDGAWPAVLTDLLDRRLQDLDEQEWRIVAALGVAERPLDESVLGRVSGIAGAALAHHVRSLRDRVLLASGDDVTLRHPLLAEAVRRRLTGVERRDLHGALARELASSADPPAGEVAAHWQGAGDAGEELKWRLRAAFSARERVALAEAADHWSRAVEIWPRDLPVAGDPPLRRSAAVLKTVDALTVRNRQRALLLARQEEEHVAELAEDEVAGLYQRLGDMLGTSGDTINGLGYVRWSLRLYDRMPPSPARVQALERLHGLLSDSGRRLEAAQVAADAVVAGRAMGEPRLQRILLATHAWHLAVSGDPAAATQALLEAEGIDVPGGDPMGDLEIAVDRTDILLRAGATAAEVVAAAGRAMSAIEEWGLSSYGTAILRSNLAIAFLRAGDPAAARRALEVDLSDHPDLSSWATHYELALVDLVEGHLARARNTMIELSSLDMHTLADRAEVAAGCAQVDLWDGRPGDGLARLLPVLDELSASDDADSAWPLLAAAAHAVAELRRPDFAIRVRELAATVPGGTDAAIPAHRVTTVAELARASGRDTLEDWTRAVAAWDRLGRPYDSAYARWRTAQVAARHEEHGTALRLLRRASRDARGHRPLTDAIAAT